MARHPVLTILMAIGGIILLLPGLCAVAFMTMGGLSPGQDSALTSLWIVCLAISAGGVWLLIRAFR
jgi:hypothetical protein